MTIATLITALVDLATDDAFLPLIGFVVVARSAAMFVKRIAKSGG